MEVRISYIIDGDYFLLNFHDEYKKIEEGVFPDPKRGIFEANK